MINFFSTLRINRFPNLNYNSEDTIVLKKQQQQQQQQKPRLNKLNTSRGSPIIKGTVSQTAHVQVINQKWFDVFKFVICETKWRQHNNSLAVKWLN